MPGVRAMRVGAMRLTPLPLLASAGPPATAGESFRVRPSALAVLDERLRGTRFLSLEALSVLNSPQQTGVDFCSLNPYVGCEFGCTYCYARYAHRYVVERAHDAGRLSDPEFRDFRGPHGWEAFERRIFVKEGLLGALERDLQRYLRSAGPSDRPAAPIVIGTATDPYQPGERRFRVTRRILERLARCEGLNIGIITKSPLVARDIDVLQRIGERSDLQVHVSLTTVDVGIIRRLRSEEHTSELQSLTNLVCRLLLEKKNNNERQDYLLNALHDNNAGLRCGGGQADIADDADPLSEEETDEMAHHQAHYANHIFLSPS